jgi:CheY-like chemotaxis protein
MPKGGKLTIETSNVTLGEDYGRFHAGAKPGEYVMLAISDTGSGMDTETQSHIFEPFYSTKGTKGTGLGLSTVYGIVKQSGAYIWVYSEPGKGSTFKVYFPRVTEVREFAVAQPAAAETNTTPAKETILLVEDEANLRRMAKQYLENQGYTVLEAPDGSAAIQICFAYAGPIDLLLTDVIMPGMNGRELAQRVGSLRPDLKVLYMSGYTENAIGHNGTLDVGVTLLQKPFTLQALKQKVREMLDSGPLAKELDMSARSSQGVQLTKDRIPAFRAQRFNLHLPLRYRLLGQDEWRQGTTENISRSGLLFRGEEMLQLNAQLEINLVLPAEIAGLSATEVVCRGEVVRAEQPGNSTLHPSLAAKILQYHFQHGSHIMEA